MELPKFLEEEKNKDYCFCGEISAKLCKRCFKNSFYFNLFNRAICKEIGDLGMKNKDTDFDSVQVRLVNKYNSFFKEKKYKFGDLFSQELAYICKNKGIKVGSIKKSFPFNIQAKFYGVLLTEKITSLMERLYQSGQNLKPNTMK
eukprot:TRINITY_DN782_c0_g1_i3.p1 TRINITY_DN782_c0_g1~~TRINITY_DN782_c0_g1_i3.p1  ORF type:complete len:145 (+),score=27.82 TRINITY_DN782_c0_g1_i3:67-501(+)